jgi:hypothetical protein
MSLVSVVCAQLKTIDYDALIRLTEDACSKDDSAMSAEEFAEAVRAAVEQCPLDKAELSGTQACIPRWPRRIVR